MLHLPRTPEFRPGKSQEADPHPVQLVFQDVDPSLDLGLLVHNDSRGPSSLTMGKDPGLPLLDLEEREWHLFFG